MRTSHAFLELLPRVNDLVGWDVRPAGAWRAGDVRALRQVVHVDERVSCPAFEQVAGDAIGQPGLGRATAADARERDEPQLWIVGRRREKPGRDHVEPIGPDQRREFAAVVPPTGGVWKAKQVRVRRASKSTPMVGCRPVRL
jgi:hypothetical protein